MGTRMQWRGCPSTPWEGGPSRSVPTTSMTSAPAIARTRPEAQHRTLHEMPRQEGERRRCRQGDQEYQPPHSAAAAEPYHRLFDGPAIDVEAIGQIAEPCRRNDRQSRVQGEP